MLQAIGKNWWTFAVQGVAAVLFGLMALAWPDKTLAFLIALFGAYALVDGVMALVAMFQTTDRGIPWWAWLLRGVTGIGAALATFAYPGMTALVLLYIIAAWALLAGVFEIVAAVQFRKELEGEWTMIASGVLSVILGLWLFAAPGAGALALTMTIGIFAIIIGVLLVALGFRIRGIHERLESRMHARVG